MASAERRVLIAHVPDLQVESSGNVLHLRNPKSGTKTCYLLINGVLQELHWFKQRYSSWFIGDSVCEDGSLYLASPMDPIFMVLPILEKARMKRDDDNGKFRLLEEALYVNDYPGYARLMPVLIETLSSVCEVKEIGESKYYRLDDCKLLAWLCCKVNKVSGALSLLSSFKNLNMEEMKNYSVGLLGEYLDDSWLQKLASHLGVDLEASKRSRVATPFLATLTTSTATDKQSALLNKKAKLKAQPAACKITSFFARPR